MPTTLGISGGTVVTPSGSIPDGYVVVTGSRIDSVGRGRPPELADRRIDATGSVVIPGLIDLHGDDIEGHLFPRVDVSTDPQSAVVAADRSNLCHGVTTKYHAVAFEETPDDNRSIEAASAVASAIESHASLVGDNRLHARCEVATDRFESVCAELESHSVDLLSIMHHEPGAGQYRREGDFIAKYDGNAADPKRIERFIESRRQPARREYDRRTEALGTIAASKQIPLASHDDEAVERVEAMAAIGVSIAEFPLTIDAARRADALGMTIAMGAPNLASGGSHWGNLSAERAIAEGCLDVLCSDYSPASLLASIFVQTGEPLHERVARVTTNPAEAVGLTDRGRLAEGHRADIIVVDTEPFPTVRNAIVAGRERLDMQAAPLVSVDAPHAT